MFLWVAITVFHRKFQFIPDTFVCSEIAFYADFVNDTEYVNKVSYGYNPSTVVKGVAVVGDPGRSYRLAEFMNTLLNAMVSKATLLSCE